MEPVRIAFPPHNAGGANGNATIDGGDAVSLTSTAVIQVVGTEQTSVSGHRGGVLNLVASLGGVSPELARSNRFAVAAIPENVTASNPRAIEESDVRGVL